MTRGAVPGALLVSTLAAAAPLAAQPEAGPGLQLSAFAGALRAGDDLALDADAQWTAVIGGRVGWRPAPEFTVSAEVWRGSLERVGEGARSTDVIGVGAFATFRPWTGRGWPADFAFDFGLEIVDANDEEDRDPGFVFGLGLERRVSRRVVLEAVVRHHFMTIDEGQVDGVATGRDAEMWEVRAGISLARGGAP